MQEIHGAQIKDVKIARVSTVAFFIETQLRAQITSLVESSANVTLVASETSLSQKFPGTEYVSIDIPRQISPLKDLMALVRLWRLFRKHKFDIVHSTTPKAGLLCAVAGKLAGISIRIHSFTGQPWVTLNGFKRQVAKCGDWLIGHLNTACYADSESQKAFLVSQKLVSSNKLSVIGKGSLAGVDVKRFDPDIYTLTALLNVREELGIPLNAFIFLFVGRIVKDKGVVELIEAFKTTLSEHFDQEIYLLMVGPQELSNEELGITANSELSRKVTFTGYTDVPEKFMAVSDVLCIPSYREGFGTVVIEAAAMGLPTIGSNIYGLSDAIIDGQTGILVAPKNVSALSQALNKLIDDVELRNELAHKAQLRARQDFSSDVVNDLVIAEYAALLNQFKKHS